MEQSIEEFFQDFRQDLLVDAELNGTFQLSEFMETVARELVDTGFTEGFELCHYRARRGLRVDGYWFSEEGVLDLFVADFESRSELESLPKSEMLASFKRVSKFLEASANDGLWSELEVTSPEYGLGRQISERRDSIRRVNLFLFSERTLTEKIQAIADSVLIGVPTVHHVWDISRLHRQRSSRTRKEPLDIDFQELFGKGVACLPAHLGTDDYESYLMVIPGDVLASLYERFGGRLLEQNVRTFLQARGNVNQGIRATIINEPRMFFAYNNGVTATAQSVVTRMTKSGLCITKVVDLQIVNGGQTTASLYHTRKRDKADLAGTFVQMKLSVIADREQGERVVPKISEYANTQNRVNAADFFSNHPFHVRMEAFSRRLWAPAQHGAARETRWFYERARGQYADAQSKLTSAEQRRFKAEHPKRQMFSKTDLAKFENVWDDHPKWVNLGSQKNFAQYAKRIGLEWERSSDEFNELYFKRAVARGLVFRETERIVSSQPWYNGGYRANLVAYTIALIGEITRARRKSVDFLAIWNAQEVDELLKGVISIVARSVNDEVMSPAAGISNVSEWCKKDACWTRVQARSESTAARLPREFFDRLVSRDEQVDAVKSARQTQKIDDGIEAQRRVLSTSSADWKQIHKVLSGRGLLNQLEDGVVRVAMQIPAKIPTEKQSIVLLGVLEKARTAGVAAVKK